MDRYAKNISKTMGVASHLLNYSLVMAVTMILFAGCGGGGGGSSSNSGSGTGTGSHTTNGIMGTTECYNCHADGMILSAAGEAKRGGDTVKAYSSTSNNTIFSSWLYGPHGNYEGMYHADHGTSNEGFPSHAYNGLSSDQACIDCHDYGNDGLGFENYYVSTGRSYLGIVNRPVVGCESCHGSGANHFAAGGITSVPGSAACGKCHDAGVGQAADHATLLPEENRVYEDYLASPHGNSINTPHYVTGSTTDVKGSCSRCHTDEGGRLYKDMQGGHDALAAALAANPAVVNANSIQCHTCHDAHDPDQLLQPAVTGLSSEYQTCINCHQDADGYHGENSAYSWSGFSVGVGTFNSGRIIYDTHLKDDNTTPEIEGYNVDPSNSRVCRDCHNVHAVDNTINNDWADSAHGGHILSTIDTNGNASVTDTEGAAWVHYDFKGPSRQACQRCHTSTGFKNFSADPAAYDPANNDFSYLTGEQREMLYCWACHTDSAGGLRDPGVFANVSPYSEPAARIAAVPDLSGSNICMSCHSARQSGQSAVKDKDFATEIAGMHFGNITSHYLAAGGVMFRTVGYEYAGMDYSNVVYFAHDKIGTAAGTGIGENGPCVSCHMKNADGHKFVNVTKDGSGDVTAIPSWSQICSNCHVSEANLVTTLNTLETGFDAALSAITAQLATKGIYYNPASGYPYVFSSPTVQHFGTAFTAWPDMDTLGATYNLDMLSHLPGAYVHNNQYVRKLIYDSIDFLDDGAHNKSVEATLGGAGDAYDYLGGTR